MVAYDADVHLLGSLRGEVPRNLCPSQSARDSEDYAVLMASRHAAGRYMLHSDCNATVACGQDLASGTGLGQPRAHMWRQAAAGDALEDVTFSKVLAHATWNDVVEGRITAWQRDGNHAADAPAKAGAAVIRPFSRR